MIISARPLDRSVRPNPSRLEREDHLLSVAWGRLFDPDPDPTEPYRQEAADIDGYVMTSDHTVTVAATAATSGGLDMLDSVWSAIRRKGIARRRLVLLDDRGRTVSVMTFVPPVADGSLRLLRSLLVVPIHLHDGRAEVHLLATRDEVAAVEGALKPEARQPSSATPAADPTVRETPGLQPEDWAFLGLLCCVGAFDGPEGPSPSLLAELLDLDPPSFARQAIAIEHALGGLVTDLFSPSRAAT